MRREERGEAFFRNDVLASERGEVGGELGAFRQEGERRRGQLRGSPGGYRSSSSWARGVEAVVEVRAGDLGVDACPSDGLRREER